MSYRILLSPPHVDGDERTLLAEALDSGWVAAAGPQLDAFERELAERVRKLVTQAREPARHYGHTGVGFNLRLSNLLAALGRGQLARLDAKVARRRAINARYRALLGDLPGLAFPPDDPDGLATRWLTCLTLDPEAAGADRDQLIDALEAEGIEARPVWKPMHLQPAFADGPAIGDVVAAAVRRRLETL